MRELLHRPSNPPVEIGEMRQLPEPRFDGGITTSRRLEKLGEADQASPLEDRKPLILRALDGAPE
jgi:hypothetical protein